MDLNLIFAALVVVVSLIGIFLGILAYLRCTGRLKASLGFIVLSLAALSVYHLGIFINFTGSAIGVNIGDNLSYFFKLEEFEEGLHLIISVLVAISLLLMNQMINDAEKLRKKK